MRRAGRSNHRFDGVIFGAARRFPNYRAIGWYLFGQTASRQLIEPRVASTSFFAEVKSKTRKPERPLLERLGGRFVQAGNFAPDQADDPIHMLNPVERAGLSRVTRGAVLRAPLCPAR